MASDNQAEEYTCPGCAERDRRIAELGAASVGYTETKVEYELALARIRELDAEVSRLKGIKGWVCGNCGGEAHTGPCEHHHPHEAGDSHPAT